MFCWIEPIAGTNASAATATAAARSREIKPFICSSRRERPLWVGRPRGRYDTGAPIPKNFHVRAASERSPEGEPEDRATFARVVAEDQSYRDVNDRQLNAQLGPD